MVVWKSNYLLHFHNQLTSVSILDPPHLPGASLTQLQATIELLGKQFKTQTSILFEHPTWIQF